MRYSKSPYWYLLLLFLLLTVLPWLNYEAQKAQAVKITIEVQEQFYIPQVADQKTKSKQPLVPVLSVTLK